MKYVMPIRKHGRTKQLALVLILCVCSTVGGQELSKLPYVPTPQIVVDEMLKMASVTADDYLIDLGSGDGRIVISAAKQYRSKGLGVDIDPKLVALSLQNAKNAKVDDRVEFIERDMFKTEIGKATVLMLYVMPDFMSLLRSKVLKELKPGTRVVAHDYHMGDWYFDRMVTLTVPEKKEANGTDKAYLYLWVVPADVEGIWRVDFDGETRSEEVVLTISQRYQMISARAEKMRKPLMLEKPTLRGAKIDFSVVLETMRYQFTGRVNGDKMQGTAMAADGKGPYLWRGTRVARGN